MALAHILSNRAKLLDAFKSHGLISFGAGASVAYVFVHVFSEIGVFQQQLTGHDGHSQSIRFLSQPLYLAALGGLCLLYIMDTIETRFQDESSNELQPHKYFMQLFSTRTILYCLYNIMISYIVTERPGEGLLNIALITIALMLHFIVINVRGHEKYGELFSRYMRWPAAGGLIVGWVLGIIVDIPDAITVTIFSTIGGMITYIALKSELPETNYRAPYHFLAGAFIYTIISLAIPYFGLSHLATH